VECGSSFALPLLFLFSFLFLGLLRKNQKTQPKEENKAAEQSECRTPQKNTSFPFPGTTRLLLAEIQATITLINQLSENLPVSADDANLLRLQLLDQLLHLPAAQLAEVERLLKSLDRSSPAPASKKAPIPVVERDWPHAPLHRLSKEGTYIVTAATADKAHSFKGAERLDYLETQLLAQLKAGGWQLEAWAVFSNHYHFVGQAQPGATPLKDLLKELHRSTGLHVNELDGTPGRQVWFNYWETELSYETSYLARLNYVHQNAAKHGLVAVANQYRWCSAAWFERTASPAQVKTIYCLKTDRVHVEDDFEPI